MRRLRGRLTYANVLATLALFFALGGFATAAPTKFLAIGATAGGDLAGTYPDPEIAGNAVDGADVADDSLTGADIDESTLSADSRFGSNTSLAASGRMECVLGDVGLAAGMVASATVAKGQILSISQNTALFSLLGTTYGGDGRTTFALPDLRGAAPNGLTYYICTEGIYPARQ